MEPSPCKPAPVSTASIALLTVKSAAVPGFSSLIASVNVCAVVCSAALPASVSKVDTLPSSAVKRVSNAVSAAANSRRIAALSVATVT